MPCFGFYLLSCLSLSSTFLTFLNLSIFIVYFSLTSCCPEHVSDFELPLWGSIKDYLILSWFCVLWFPRLYVNGIIHCWSTLLRKQANILCKLPKVQLHTADMSVCVIIFHLYWFVLTSYSTIPHASHRHNELPCVWFCSYWKVVFICKINV